MQEKTAGELAQKALSDNTKYDALEVGHSLTDNILPHLLESAHIYQNKIDEPEYCVVMLLAKDQFVVNAMRRKFYCWPYLPKPRPNQSVFLYNKAQDKITKRLWILPSDMVMAELRSLSVVHKRYQTMKTWTDAFYKGWKFIKDNPQNPNCKEGKFVNTDPFHFWKVIREQSGIDMPSEHEFFLAHREELIQAGCQIPNSFDTEPFDFSKVTIKKIVNPQASMIN